MAFVISEESEEDNDPVSLSSGAHLVFDPSVKCTRTQHVKMVHHDFPWDRASAHSVPNQELVAKAHPEVLRFFQEKKDDSVPLCLLHWFSEDEEHISLLVGPLLDF